VNINNNLLKLTIYSIDDTKRVSILKISTNYSSNKDKNVNFFEKSYLDSRLINAIIRFYKSNCRRTSNAKIKVIRVILSRDKFERNNKQTNLIN